MSIESRYTLIGSVRSLEPNAQAAEVLIRREHPPELVGDHVGPLGHLRLGPRNEIAQRERFARLDEDLAGGRRIAVLRAGRPVRGVASVVDACTWIRLSVGKSRAVAVDIEALGRGDGLVRRRSRPRDVKILAAAPNLPGVPVMPEVGVGVRLQEGRIGTRLQVAGFGGCRYCRSTRSESSKRPSRNRIHASAMSGLAEKRRCSEPDLS